MVSLFKAKNMKLNSERKKKKTEDVAYRPGDGNLVRSVCLPSLSVIICCVVIGSAGFSVLFRGGFMKMDLLGQLNHPTNQKTTTPSPSMVTGSKTPNIPHSTFNI
ncbi:hypothetical protein ILYODFUR_011123 [Ilyodon furcidens]|uniref:Uncharacterized protein n=1 Tax=Ilyodon furcidens TaxID=33524 RepID=A0ABV0SXE2_9TELE